jgi:uncharacterized protein involved in response to NO
MNHPATQRKHALAQPFAIFFTLAAIDAMIAAGAWLLTLAPTGASSPSPGDVAVWHAREMLFGYLSAALSGFFLTALPRWTRRPVPVWAVRCVLATWLVARFAPLPPHPVAFLAALPCVVLAFTAGLQIAAASDGRNIKTVLLLALYAGAVMKFTTSAGGAAQDAALRLAVAALIGLVMLIGGRVLPELTFHFDARCGEAPPPNRNKAVEIFAALSAGLALVFWLAQTGGRPVALVFLCAAAAQLWRMAVWLGRRTASSPALCALYAAYGSLPAGFALLGAHALAPGTFPESAVLHLWMAGGFGGMTLAIMSSMIRRRNGLAFAVSGAGDATALFWLVAVLCRTVAAFAPGHDNWLVAAACAWLAAFATFLFDFRAPLLRGMFRR